MMKKPDEITRPDLITEAPDGTRTVYEFKTHGPDLVRFQLGMANAIAALLAGPAPYARVRPRAIHAGRPGNSASPSKKAKRKQARASRKRNRR